MDNSAALFSCLRSGVDRVELCSALAVGGLTPSYGLMKLAGRLAESAAVSGVGGIRGDDKRSVGRPPRTQVLAMIRPRSGNFCFSTMETTLMCEDIAVAREAGLAGVVLGAATAEGTLDLPILARLCHAAEGLQLTLHRVIDVLDDPLLAIDQAVELGFTRILTSGGAPTVADGLSRLSAIQMHAGRRIQIMAGAGLTPTLAKRIQAEIGIESFHASCRRQATADPVLSAFGFSGEEGELDVALIDDYRRSLASVDY
ncbi:copper homeostasis protein CutC [Granulosicoccus sp. 3-233]